MLSRGGGKKGGSVGLEWQPCQNGWEQRHNHSSIALAAERALSNQHSIAGALLRGRWSSGLLELQGVSPSVWRQRFGIVQAGCQAQNETEKVCPWARDGLRYGDCGGHFDRRLALGRIGSRSDELDGPCLDQ